MSKTYLDPHRGARHRPATSQPVWPPAIADPLWLLGRQWQFGELLGEDTGSPVCVELAAEAAQVSRFRRPSQTAGTPTTPRSCRWTR